MKIALVSPYDYPYPGGVTAHIHHLDEEFTRLGHAVKVIAPSSSDEDVLERENVLKLGSVVRIPSNGSVARITLSLRLSGRVKQILDREQFDVVHLHEPLLPALPLTVLRHSHALNVGTFHAYSGNHIAYFYARPILKHFFGKLEGVTAVSEVARDFVIRHFPAEYAIIPNGIDPERFSHGWAPLPQFADCKRNLLFVGRLEKRKGFKYLLRAFQRVKREEPETRLIVAGAYSDKDRRRYECIIRRQGLRDVVFTGYLSDDELARCYQSAAICCAPSTGSESFGIVLLEAMAAGKALVASNILGYRAVVEHGLEGLLVPPRDDEALAAALLRLLRSESEREAMGRRGQVKAQAYTWPKIARRVLAYYDELHDRRALRRAVDRTGSSPAVGSGRSSMPELVAEQRNVL